MEPLPFPCAEAPLVRCDAGRGHPVGGIRVRLPSFRSPAWVLAETATTSVFSLLSMLAIGRVIGPEAAGTGMIAIAAFALLDILGATLFTDALVQRPGLTRRQVASALTVAALAGCGMAAVLALGAPWLAAASGVAQVETLCLALAPLLLFSAFAGSGSGPVLRESRFALLAARVLIGQPLALAVRLWMAASGWGAWAMIGNQAVATLVAFLMLLASGRLLRRPRIERAALVELWPVALPQVTALVIMMGRYRLFLLALGISASEAVLAVSHLAFRMLESVVLVVAQTTGRIGMPWLCALHADREAQAEAFGDLAQLQALLGLPAAAGIALIAPDLVALLLGPARLGTAPIAPVRRSPIPHACSNRRRCGMSPSRVFRMRWPMAASASGCSSRKPCRAGRCAGCGSACSTWAQGCPGYARIRSSRGWRRRAHRR
jgi:PST family polysaccharide transporter